VPQRISKKEVVFINKYHSVGPFLILKVFHALQQLNLSL